MTEQSFTITVNLDELMTEFMPKMARQYIEMRGAQEELNGTELTLTMDISGTTYSYTIKDGVDFDVQQGELENPMVHISFSLDSMAKLADMKYIDMLLGMQRQLSREKYDLLSSTSGTCVFKMSLPGDEMAEIKATFNGAETPSATFTLSMDDAKDVVSGKGSPVQLFMSGKLALEGDMAFAMANQQLFA